MAGARCDRALWVRFTTAAKQSGWTVAEALENALRAALNRGIPQKKGRAA
jgi:hypothetical protein